MLNKLFDQINDEGLKTLIEAETRESKTLEYKGELPKNTEDDKKEFWADVSSFANASGGDIFYGVKGERDASGKSTGIPEKVYGLNEINIDKEILRLESLIRDGIDPRIPGVRIKPLKGLPSGIVLFIRVPKSWATPHMVKNTGRFFSRNSAGKFPLDVREVRAAFLVSDTQADKIRRFRSERLVKIIADETPLLLDQHPKVILHLMPISSLDPTFEMDIKNLKENTNLFQPIYTDGTMSSRINFDGIITYANLPNSSRYYSYLQVFRNGCIESVNAYLLSESNGEKVIPTLEFERELIIALNRYLEGFAKNGLEPPFFLMVSLLGVKEYRISGGTYVVDRNELLLPEKIIESFDEKAEKILKPVFDAIWQASGWTGSKNYNSEGKWIGK